MILPLFWTPQEKTHYFANQLITENLNQHKPEVSNLLCYTILIFPLTQVKIFKIHRKQKSDAPKGSMPMIYHTRDTIRGHEGVCIFYSISSRCDPANKQL